MLRRFAVWLGFPIVQGSADVRPDQSCNPAQSTDLDPHCALREGYRRDVYRDPETGNTMPVLAASVSSERLFDVLMDLLTPLGGS